MRGEEEGEGEEEGGGGRGREGEERGDFYQILMFTKLLSGCQIFIAGIFCLWDKKLLRN